jgi:hypothetical protein
MFKLRCPLAKNAIRIEISPAQKYTCNFTIDDWRQLWKSFLLTQSTVTTQNARRANSSLIAI